MSAEPIVREVKRYVCPFCHTGRSKRPTAQAHIDQCWMNPAQQSCGTCAHYDKGYPGDYDEGPGEDPSCLVDADMRAGTDTGEFRIVRLCPSWQAKPSAERPPFGFHSARPVVASRLPDDRAGNPEGETE